MSSSEGPVESNEEDEKIEEPEIKTSSLKEEPSEEISSIDAARPSTSKAPSLASSLLGGSISDLLEETKKELGEIKENARPIDLKIVQKVWKEHIESVESPSTKATLEKVIIVLKDKDIKVVVPSNVSKEEIAQELSLYQKLRDEFNNPQLNIILEVDRAQFPDLLENENTRMYTMKEKYDYLVDKNPELNNLVSALKLKIDQE